MFWDEVREALVSVVETSVKYDEDGIDVYFFNSPVVVNNVRSAQDVRSLFRRVDPRRSTPTAKALKRVLEPYLASLEQANSAKERGQPVQTVKPLNVVILTGELSASPCNAQTVIADLSRGRRWRTGPRRGARGCHRG